MRTVWIRRKHAFVLYGAITLCGPVLLANDGGAQTTTPLSAKQRLPHQQIAGASDSDGSSLVGDKPQPGRNPAAIDNDGRLLPEPAATEPAKPDERVHTDSKADRQTEWRADDNTGPDSTLTYTTVFNPSVIPFKRMTAMDAVRADYTLYSASSADRDDLPIAGSPKPGRDLFWGTLSVRLQTGVDVPIPSVSPDMRILSYEIHPNTRVTFSRDGADNYYVHSDETGVSGTYRLVFLADADARHFATRVPEGYRVRDVARHRRPHPIPANARHTARRVLAKLGIRPRTSLRRALDIMVKYFREFTAKPLTNRTGDIYWDLFHSKAGVCRHRAFAFMVTANAAGIPTRYVINEAHAWVEVYVPEVGYLRIDLGGAALRMDVTNAESKTIHRPQHEDDFPKPKEYDSNYTRLEGDIRGLSNKQLEEAKEPLPSADEFAEQTNGGNAADTEGSEAGDTAADSPGADGDYADHQAPGLQRPGSAGDENGPPTEVAPDGVAPDDTTPPPPDTRKPTTLRVVTASSVGFRGQAIRVTGSLVDSAGAGVGNQRVDVFLAPDDDPRAEPIRVGHAMTTSDGQYEASIQLPRQLPLRKYEVYAQTSGDSDYRQAVSE